METVLSTGNIPKRSSKRSSTFCKKFRKRGKNVKNAKTTFFPSFLNFLQKVLDRFGRSFQVGVRALKHILHITFGVQVFPRVYTKLFQNFCCFPPWIIVDNKNTFLTEKLLQREKKFSLGKVFFAGPSGPARGPNRKISPRYVQKTHI